MKRLIHRVVGLTATLSLLVVAAPPTQAAELTLKDETGDSARYVYDLDSGDSSISAAPTEQQTDLTRVRFNFKRDSVVASARVRQLDRRTRVGVGVGANGKRYEVDAGKEGQVRVLSDGESRKCAGGTFQVLRRTQSYRFTIPLSCIGNPTTARFGFAVVRAVRRNDGRVETLFDDALRDGARRLPEQIKLGQPLSRGWLPTTEGRPEIAPQVVIDTSRTGLPDATRSPEPSPLTA